MVETFDYIVVGGGSSGCVIANRLSSNPKNRVLLIEAGPPDSAWQIEMPKGYALILREGRLVWQYEVPAEKGALKIRDRWVRGRTLGGSSSINGLLYLRGHAEDYDMWERDLGLAGWGWKAFQDAYLAFEDHELGATAFRGAGGPLHISLTRNRSYIMEQFMKAASEVGLKRTDEPNEIFDECISYSAATIKGGRRCSASKAFIRPIINRPNLKVVTDTVVDRVLFEDRRTTGVVCRRRGVALEYGVSGEVVLAAGTCQTPKILQLSGIGPAEVLRPLGIGVIHDCPQVGRNLRDHLCLVTQYRLSGDYSYNTRLRGWRVLLEGLKYKAFRRGLLDGPAFDVTGFARSEATARRPDTQILASPFSQRIDSWKQMKARTEIDDKPGLSIFACLMNPESRGAVRICSSEPEYPLDIVHNHLSDWRDRQTAVAMLRFVRRLVDQPPISRFIKYELTPGAEIKTSEEIIKAFETFSGSGQHAVGTCAMGVDESYVIDPRLRVRGVFGLRVADLSIFPTLVTGNTNGPAMAAGWIASDLILESAH